ncbi:YraN family protein [Winogradskyella aurantiaca]|uniref:YraN family protein n=1 Tax=Winogradskyella aurantiaca TaxID=2219558 RepID=UPI000E1C7946|nr:YraN family protein [Winogradskyella aurantiaca]
MAQHYELGKNGEQLAVDYLIAQGYNVRARNYRFERAEVDILAEKNGILAAVEVKTRTSREFGNPQDFVKPRQIQNLVKAVDAYILEESLDLEVRFDIIAIIKTNEHQELEHLKNAFYHF